MWTGLSCEVCAEVVYFSSNMLTYGTSDWTLEGKKEAESSNWLHTGINGYLQSLQMDSLKAQSMWSTKLWRSVIRPRNSDLISHFAVDCCSLYYATKSQNSSYRMKTPSEIIKTNWTLYSILHVPCVLKMEWKTQERYFEWQKQKWTTLFAAGYKPVQWQCKPLPTRIHETQSTL